MNFLPKDLEDIILDYKLDLEVYDTRKKFQKSLIIIKQFNHNIYTSSKRPLEQIFMIGIISARICDICGDFINTRRTIVQKRCMCRYH